MSLWIYVLDSFKPIDADVGKILSLVQHNPLELFNRYVKAVVKKDLGDIDRVELYDVYFNPKEFELLIEYIVTCALGEISVKVIYSRDPKSTLMHYYEYEKRKIR